MILKKILPIIFLSLSVNAKTQFELGYGGITIHGTEPGDNAAKFMPNKIDNNGYIVAHDSVTLNFREAGNFMSITLLKDCYFKQAANIGAGFYREDSFLRPGVIFSVYIREKAVFERYYEDDNNIYLETARPNPLPLTMSTGGYEVIPMGMVTVSPELGYIGDHPVILNLGTNIILTHINLVIGF